MIRVFLSFYGQRPVVLLFICKTGVCTVPWGEKNPKEMFTGKMPEIGNLRIFGCLTYTHVSSEKRTKLEATRENGIFFWI